MRNKILAVLMILVMVFTVVGCGSSDSNSSSDNSNNVSYTFRYDDLLQQHYKKHGIAMGFNSAEEYQEAASDVINNPDALHKTESEDGDDVYYIEKTNEFVVLSTDGYIRTYFNPDDGEDYYDRQ